MGMKKFYRDWDPRKLQRAKTESRVDMESRVMEKSNVDFVDFAIWTCLASIKLPFSSSVEILDPSGSFVIQCYPFLHTALFQPMLPPFSSSSSPAPSYSSLPLIDEETIEYNVRPTSPPLPQGTFVRQWGKTTLILNDQDDAADEPAYGRHSVISGEVGVGDSEHILSVTLKLEGRLNLSISDGGRSNTTIVSAQHTLWRSENTQGQRCPSLMPFSIRFPSSYHNGDRNRRLPPSYEVAFHGIPALYAKCTYSLSLIVTKMRHKRLSFWTSCKTRTIGLTYRPRSRPHRPILPINSLFSTIKPLPEEWRQIVTEIRPRPDSNLQPISCHFFIPSVQTFGLSDTIPFHIQLTGSLESLTAFLPPDSAELTPPSLSSKSSLGIPPSHLLNRPAIRVSIARQVLVEVQERKTWRNSTLGEGSVWPVPPGAMNSSIHIASDPEDVTIDWGGEVKCGKEVTSVGFSTGGLVIKDFIVFGLTPSNARSSPLLEVQHAHPIKLVTDPWMDVDDHSFYR
ncbi:hypothetical protein HGRIS_002593 [Hohenbuehelia grisea]|uniref:Uncharacterized protein n=1 Tax=Hohenbuehelia grisea TaxID=104357 RepID=A0ABR3JLV8_9AGAR